MLYPQIQKDTPLTPLQIAFNRFIENDNGIRGTVFPLSDDNFDLVWHVGADYMPQDMLDLIGVDAITLFQVSALFDQARAILDPSFVPRTAPFPITFNADGSVTVTMPAPVDPTPTPDPVSGTTVDTVTGTTVDTVSGTTIDTIN